MHVHSSVFFFTFTETTHTTGHTDTRPMGLTGLLYKEGNEKAGGAKVSSKLMVASALATEVPTRLSWTYSSVEHSSHNMGYRTPLLSWGRRATAL